MPRKRVTQNSVETTYISTRHKTMSNIFDLNGRKLVGLHNIRTGKIPLLRSTAKTPSNSGEQLDANTDVVNNTIADADETQDFD